MALFDFLYDENRDQQAEDKSFQLKAATRGDLFRAAKEDAQINQSLFNDNISAYIFKAQNRQLLEDIEQRTVDDLINAQGDQLKIEYQSSVTSDERKDDIFDSMVLSLREKNPEKYSDVLTNAEIKELIKKERLGVRQEYLQAREGAPQDFLSDVVDFAGQAYGQISSVENALAGIATAPFTVPKAGAGLAYRLFVGGAKAAGVNAAFEAGTQPFIAEELKDAKISYDAGDYVNAVAGAAGAGFVLNGVGELSAAAAKKLFGKNNNAAVFDELSGISAKEGDKAYADVLSGMADVERVNDMDLSKVGDMTEGQFDDLLVRVEKSILDGEGLPEVEMKQLEPFFYKVDVERIQNQELRDLVESYRVASKIDADQAMRSLKEIDPALAKKLARDIEAEGLGYRVRAEVDNAISKLDIPEGSPAYKTKVDAVTNKVFSGEATDQDIKFYEKATGDKIVSVLDRQSYEYKRSGLEYSEYLKSEAAVRAQKAEYELAKQDLADSDQVEDLVTGKSYSAKKLQEREEFGKALAEATRFCRSI